MRKVIIMEKTEDWLLCHKIVFLKCLRGHPQRMSAIFRGEGGLNCRCLQTWISLRSLPSVVLSAHPSGSFVSSDEASLHSAVLALEGGPFAQAPRGDAAELVVGVVRLELHA